MTSEQAEKAREIIARYNLPEVVGERGEQMSNEIRELTLSRREMCDLELALTTVILLHRNTLRHEEISEDRREKAERLLQKWLTLKEKVTKQLREQDENKE